ncbi:MAG: RNB domain-containing ribonuclease, partial [Clostridia bacterium]|nr:RNB domain-containing ribonuclease [Clostridia bacterium]
MNEILNIINKLGRGVTLQELCEITEKTQEQLLPQIRQLMAELALVEIKGKYALPKQMGLLIGEISINVKGFGFLRQDDEDVFIPADSIGFAMDGDIVSVRLRQKKFRGHSKEGYVADVIFRNTETVIGTVKRNGDKFRLIPKNKKVLHDIKLEDLADARDGDIVIAKILRYPSKRNKLVVSVLSVLGRAGDANIEVDCAIAEMDIPKVFGKEAIKQAKATPQAVEDTDGRTDFRNELVITIDGDYSKDFDDAVSLCKTNGGYILKVRIADVSHYV